MSDRPTPETDASRGYALSSHYGRLEGSYLQMDRSGPFVHAEVARKLERERDKAREKCANLGMAMSYSPVSTSLLSKFLQAIKERNETKLALCSLAKQFESDIQKANAMAEKAKALIDRWDKPSWKDTAPTAGFIYALRTAVEDYEKTLVSSAI